MVDQGAGAVRRSATVVVLFCDLVGSTERQTRIGDDAADAFRRRFFAALTAAVAETDGEVVKTIGDAVMAVYRHSAVDAVRGASLMHDRAEALDPDDPAFVRVGLSAGEAACEDGDWFGTPVVEAARLCAAANSGQTLATETVRTLVGTRGGHQFRSVGALSLKGLSEPLPSAEVLRTPVAPPPTVPTAKTTTRSRKPWLALSAAVVVAALAAVTVLALRENDDGEATKTAVLPAAAYTPRLTPAKCPAAFASPVPEGRCEDLAVPEDRTKPDGRWIHMIVMRAPARSGVAPAEPTIAITCAELCTSEDPVTSPARDHAELITIGTRVSPDTDPSTACPEFEPIGRALFATHQDDPTTTAAGEKALGACYRRLSKEMDLAHYTFLDAAEDVLDLMRALHVSSVNLSTSGEFAITAFEVVRAAPDAVRTLTLVNPVAPGASRSTDPTAALVGASDRYDDLCHADPACKAAYPDLPGRRKADVSRFDANPETIETPTLDGKHRLRVLVDGPRLVRGASSVLGNPAFNGVLAAGIYSPDIHALASAIAGWDAHLQTTDFPWARILSTACSYEIYTRSPAASSTSALRPELSGIDDRSLEWQCRAWKVPKVAQRAFDRFATAIPTMIVNGGLDPNRLPAWSQTLETGMPNAVTLTFPTLGFAPLGTAPPCLNHLRRTFLADPTARLDGPACVGEAKPIDFLIASK